MSIYDGDVVGDVIGDLQSVEVSWDICHHITYASSHHHFVLVGAVLLFGFISFFLDAPPANRMRYLNGRGGNNNVEEEEGGGGVDKSEAKCEEDDDDDELCWEIETISLGKTLPVNFSFYVC